MANPVDQKENKCQSRFNTGIYEQPPTPEEEDRPNFSFFDEKSNGSNNSFNFTLDNFNCDNSKSPTDNNKTKDLFGSYIKSQGSDDAQSNLFNFNSNDDEEEDLQSGSFFSMFNSNQDDKNSFDGVNFGLF